VPASTDRVNSRETELSRDAERRRTGGSQEEFSDRL